MYKKLALLFVVAVVAALSSSGCSQQSQKARYLENGKKFLDKKDYARAILQFQNAVKADPADPEPYYQLGLACLGSGDRGGAVANLQKASRLDPKHAGAQLALAELMTHSRNPGILRQAEERARAALEASPDDPNALKTLALTEMKLGNAQDAQQHLEQALQKFPQHLSSSVMLALAKLARNDRNGAEEILKKAVQQAPQSPDPKVALATFYVMVGNTAEAEQQLRRALQIDPNNGSALLNLATLELRAERKDQAEQLYRRLSALPDKPYRPLHAIFLFQDGQHDAAIAEFEKLAIEDAADRGARTRLVAAYVTAGRSQDAEKALSQALRKNRKDSDALLQLSEIHLVSGRYAEAQADLDQVLRERPDAAEARFILAKVYLARGEVLSYRQELNETLRLDPKLLRVRLDLARAFTMAGSPNSALNLINKAPEQQKHTLAATVERNWALLALGDQQQAHKGIEEGLSIVKTRDLLLQDAVLKVQTQNFAAARPPVEEVLKHNPEDLEALKVLAYSYVAQKQDKVAIEKVRSYAAQRPKSARLQYFLGQWMQANGNTAAARGAFQAAKAADSKFEAADIALAQLDRQEGKTDDARQKLSALLASQDGDLTARMLLGYIEGTSGNYAAAIAHCRKVLETDRTNVMALNNLAYLLAEYANQPDEALKYAQQAKELAPDNIDIEDTIGWAFYRKGMFPSAVKHLEAAASREGKAVGQGTAVRKYHLAMAYLKSGSRKQGLEVLETAIKLGPDLPEAQMASAVLLQSGK